MSFKRELPPTHPRVRVTYRQPDLSYVAGKSATLSIFKIRRRQLHEPFRRVLNTILSKHIPPLQT